MYKEKNYTVIVYVNVCKISQKQHIYVLIKVITYKSMLKNYTVIVCVIFCVISQTDNVLISETIMVVSEIYNYTKSLYELKIAFEVKLMAIFQH